MAFERRTKAARLMVFQIINFTQLLLIGAPSRRVLSIVRRLIFADLFTEPFVEASVLDDVLSAKST